MMAERDCEFAVCNCTRRVIAAGGSSDRCLHWPRVAAPFAWTCFCRDRVAPCCLDILHPRRLVVVWKSHIYLHMLSVAVWTNHACGEHQLHHDPSKPRTCNPRLRRPMPYPLGHGPGAGVSQVHCLSSISMLLGKCVSRKARLLLRSPHRAARLCVSDFQKSCAQHTLGIAPKAV